MVCQNQQNYDQGFLTLNIGEPLSQNEEKEGKSYLNSHTLFFQLFISLHFLAFCFYHKIEYWALSM